MYTELGYHYAIQTHILTSLIRYTEKPWSGKIWIAKVNGIRVGLIGIAENEKNKWEIHWFAVDSNYQHLGLGKQLLDMLMQFITEKQLQQVYLCECLIRIVLYFDKRSNNFGCIVSDVLKLIKTFSILVFKGEKVYEKN